MSDFLDIVTISGRNIAEHLSPSHTTHQSSQYLIISCLFQAMLHEHCYFNIATVCSECNASNTVLVQIVLSRASCIDDSGQLIGALYNRAPYHICSYIALLLGNTGSNRRYTALCNSCGRKGNTDQCKWVFVLCL